MSAHNKFKEIFWDGFHRPDLKSEKFEQIYEERLQGLSDVLAGPLFSIYESGQCDYVFKDKDRFPRISHADDFLSWCTELITSYKDLIEAEAAETDQEKADKQVLLYQTDMMMELADLGHGLITAPRQ
ncbi:MAG: hypothetical protein ACJ75J_11010 [Cytophagaceae bacterium]|jgi:hypothetical protein